MSCSAANTSNNIYFCRGPLIAAFVFALILNFINVMFFFWLSAVWQLPWRYANINDVLQDYITKSGSVLASLSAPSAPTNLKTRAEDHTGSSCPICKLQQANPLGPGGVCFWCNVCRYGFIPLYVGIIASAVTSLLVFILPLKPWFSDWYYAILLVPAYLLYVAFVVYVFVFRVTIIGDSSQKSTTFFQLAWVLRGRSISTVFPKIADAPPPLTIATGNTAAGNTGNTPSVASGATASKPHTISEEFAKARMAETVQLLNVDLLPKEFRKVLQGNLANDEYILWWTMPNTSDIAADFKWLVHSLVAAIALGVWMWIAASVAADDAAITRLISTSSLGMLGTVVTVGSGILLLVTVMGFSRMYAVTNKRLVTVAGGVLGAHVMSAEVSTIKYASIYGYNEWGVGDILTFSWQIPGGVRKMPPIATNTFSALDDVSGFLEAFRLVAPRLNCTDVMRKNTRHNRKVWRMHIFANIVALAALPIIVIYSQITSMGIDFCLLIILGSVNVCIIQRGLRHQQTTHAPLNLAEQWTRADEFDGEGSTNKPSFLKMLMTAKPDIHLPPIHLPNLPHLRDFTLSGKSPSAGAGPAAAEEMQSKST
jgi:hypothetical protein